ncbi:MAG: hypothetical protein ABWY20_02395 [Mycobacterium sp.]
MRGHPMPNPYTVPPITDGQELLTRIRDSLRTSMNLALDGTTRNLLDPNVALGIIYNECAHTLAIVKASKDTI